MIKKIFYFLLVFSANCLKAQSLDSIMIVAQKNKTYSHFEYERLIGKYVKDTSVLNKILSKNPSISFKISLLNCKGNIYRNNAKYSIALNYHKTALSLSQKAMLFEQQAYSLNMIGVVYRRIDNIQDALGNHKDALQILEKIEPQSEGVLRSTAISLNSIGNIYLTLKQFQLAKTQFESSMQIEQRIGNKLGLAINYQNLGIISEAQKNFNEALKNYKSSLKYNLEIKSDIGKIICHNSIAQVLLNQNRTLEALKYIEPIIQLTSDMGDDFYTTLTKTNAGWIYSNLGQNSNAEKFLSEALIIANKNNFITAQEDIHKHFANFYEKSNNPQKALYHARRQQEYAQKVLNESNLKFTSELLQKYNAEKKQNQISQLEKENEAVRFKLARNKGITIFSIVLSVLMGLVFYNMYRNWQIRSERKLLVLEQQMLRSQMNPHFLFNSLNSIKLYIINNEKEKAVFYLNKFSKLMRSILNNSQEKEISLKEELDVTELYMNLENIRFDEQIQFNIIYDKSIDLEKVKIPSLILQPFVENAIWHGLSNKEGAKVLKINIVKFNKNTLSIELIDNGIGREKANEIKAQKITKQQESMGLKITQSRLNNFAKNLNGNIAIEFEDLKDINGIALGTKVRINIPY